MDWNKRVQILLTNPVTQDILCYSNGTRPSVVIKSSSNNRLTVCHIQDGKHLTKEVTHANVPQYIPHPINQYYIPMDTSIRINKPIGLSPLNIQTIEGGSIHNSTLIQSPSAGVAGMAKCHFTRVNISRPSYGLFMKGSIIKVDDLQRVPDHMKSFIKSVEKFVIISPSSLNNYTHSKNKKKNTALQVIAYTNRWDIHTLSRLDKNDLKPTFNSKDLISPHDYRSIALQLQQHFEWQPDSIDVVIQNFPAAILRTVCNVVKGDWNPLSDHCLDKKFVSWFNFLLMGN
jgi:hypothetical protein